MADVTMYYVIGGLVLTAVFTLITLVGGACDLVRLLKHLHAREADELDDGRIVSDTP